MANHAPTESAAILQLRDEIRGALIASRTGQGSYGPNYDGNKLADKIETILADTATLAASPQPIPGSPILTDERIVELYTESFNAMVGRLREAPKHVPDTVLTFARGIEADLRAALAAQPAPVSGATSDEPKGYKLVPIKITPEMIERGIAAHYGKRRVAAIGGAKGVSMTVNGTDWTGVEAMRNFWRGALSAAPEIVNPAGAVVARSNLSAPKIRALVYTLGCGIQDEHSAEWSFTDAGLMTLCAHIAALPAPQAPDTPVAPTNEELEVLWNDAHYGHAADFAADVLERWGGWQAGMLGYGGSLNAQVAAPLPAAPAPTTFKQFDGYACRGVAEAMARQSVAALPAEQAPTDVAGELQKGDPIYEVLMLGVGTIAAFNMDAGKKYAADVRAALAARQAPTEAAEEPSDRDMQIAIAVRDAFVFGINVRGYLRTEATHYEAGKEIFNMMESYDLVKLISDKVPAAPAPLPRQGEGSIDSEEFRALVGKYKLTQSFAPEPLNAIIAYIDAWHSARLARTAAPSGWWEALNELRDNTETFGPYSQETSRVAIECCMNALEELEALAPSESQAIPTDLSKRLRAQAGESKMHLIAMDRKDVLDAADEIDRYYGAALAWKRSAQAKDTQLSAARQVDHGVCICPEADRECGDRPIGWCSTCPKRAALAKKGTV